MLEAVQGGGGYQVTRDGNPVANLAFQGANEEGTIASALGTFAVRREHGRSGAWLLERHDGGAPPQLVAMAEQPSAMGSDFLFTTPDRPPLQFTRPSAWRPFFKLHDGGREVGDIRRTRGLRLRMQADIGDHIPPPLQLFALWTALLVLERAENARAVARRAR